MSCELRIRAVKLYIINNAKEVAMCSEKHLDFTIFSTEYMLFFDIFEDNIIWSVIVQQILLLCC